MSITDLVVDDNIVLGRHIVGYIVVYNKSEESVEQSQVNLLIDLVKLRLHHDVALTISGLPHVLQVVDACRQRGVWSDRRTETCDSSLLPHLGTTCRRGEEEAQCPQA